MCTKKDCRESLVVVEDEGGDATRGSGDHGDGDIKASRSLLSCMFICRHGTRIR